MTHRCGGAHVAYIGLILTLVAMPVPPAQLDRTADTTVIALFLHNFVKFADWSALDPAEPLTLCVVGDTGVAGALIESVRRQAVGGHRLDVEAMGGDASLRACHVLFISKAVTGRSAALLDRLKRLPILTVSDSEGFAQSTGIIELFLANGKMRFAVNTDAATRAGLRLSSKLLALARIVRDGPV